jgi:hypothetical protein
MTNLIAILGGLLGAVVGWIVAAAITLGVGGHYGLTDFEGARAMTAIFGIGPMGGVVGLIIGTWLGLRLRKGSAVGGSAVLVRLPLVLTAIMGLVGITYVVLYQMSPILSPDGAAPRLAFEIRLPPNSAPPAGAEIQLITEKNTMPAVLDASAARQDGDRPVLVGEVELYYRSSFRLLELKATGLPEHLFVLHLGARPGHDKDFRDWQQVSNVGNGTNQPRQATANDAYHIRYRVVWPDKKG